MLRSTHSPATKGTKLGTEQEPIPTAPIGRQSQRGGSHPSAYLAHSQHHRQWLDRGDKHSHFPKLTPSNQPPELARLFFFFFPPFPPFPIAARTARNSTSPSSGGRGWEGREGARGGGGSAPAASDSPSPAGSRKRRAAGRDAEPPPPPPLSRVLPRRSHRCCAPAARFLRGPRWRHVKSATLRALRPALPASRAPRPLLRSEFLGLSFQPRALG